MSVTDNINGIYAKDTELRNGISELRGDILSQTIKPLSVTKNGTYTSDPTVGAYGYSPITVDVQEQPWTPLQDGYSNFWFELDNDTLSPWLIFSAKTESAVIDWGDGSGEQALTTLTPTHTYSKAGKYVVKVKGVTGIARTFNSYGYYCMSLKHIELNNDVTTIGNNAFLMCVGALDIVILNDDATIGSGALRNCTLLTDFTLPENIASIPSGMMQNDYMLIKITIPDGVTAIDNNAFNTCSSLSEIHIKPTSPPSLGGAYVFSSIASNFVIYVPVGYGDTYKAASGWSTYADHILEEGQTPNRAMLAKFNSNNTDNEEMR
jgi:hypothetical protein